MIPGEDTLVDLRCSVSLVRGDSFLLLERTATQDWVLPGGRPRDGESMAACARRETREETGLDVNPTRCALVLEVIDPLKQRRVVELVFTADGLVSDGPLTGEPGTVSHWIPRAQLEQLKLRPPIAGHLPGLGRDQQRGAPYLGNMWRPDESASWASDPWAGGE